MSLILTDSERLELQQQVNARNARADVVRRASLILLLADKPVKWKYIDAKRRITTDSTVTVH